MSVPRSGGGKRKTKRRRSWDERREDFGAVPKGYPAQKLIWFMADVGKLCADPAALKAKLIEGCEIFGPSLMFYYELGWSFSHGLNEAQRAAASRATFPAHSTVVNEVLEMDLIQDPAKLAAHLAPSVFPANPRHVYLVRSGDGYYKIGIASDLSARIGNLRTGTPMGVELVHSLFHEDAREIEKSLHVRFADKRGRGEWFDLTDEDVAYIKSLTEL